MSKVKMQNRPFGPFPTVLVGANVDGKPNYATVGAFGCVCLEPILYVSLKSSHYTTQGVKQTGYFSVNVPPASLVDKTDYCGIVSGKTTDKSDVFASFYDDIGQAPMISECSINYLCKVIQTIPVSGFDMFLGEIVAAYANEQCLSDGRLDPTKVDPIVMLEPNYLDLHQVIGTVFRTGRGAGQ